MLFKKDSYRSTLLAAAFGLASSWTFAQGVAGPSRPLPFFEASRALSMGDAYTAYDTGFESVFYNPAGVARKTSPHIKFFDLEAYGSQASLMFLEGLSASLMSLQGLINNVSQNPGLPYSVGLNFVPQFLVKNFSIGFLGRAHGQAYVDPTSLDMNIYEYADVGIYAATGVSLFGGLAKIGVGAKWLDRAAINDIYSVAQYSGGNLTLTNQWKEGVATGFDAGLLLTAPVAGLPTLGIAMQDIGGTVFTEHHLIFAGSQSQPGAPDPIAQRINVGLSATAKHGRGIKSVYAFEVKDVANIGVLASEHYDAGFELDLNNIFTLRAGLHQGIYWTGGIGLHIGGVGLEVATYGEDVGAGTGTRVDDRKYVGRYVLSF